MKYTVEGFDQERLVAAGMDMTDVGLLRWFVDFAFSGRMKKRDEGEQTYYWVRYDYVIEDMPILAITDKGALSRRFGKLVKAGFLDHLAVKDSTGTFSYFGAGPALQGLLEDPPSVSKEGRGPSQKTDGSVSKEGPVLLKKQTKDPSSIDPSTRDSPQSPVGLARSPETQGPRAGPPPLPSVNPNKGKKPDPKHLAVFNWSEGQWEGITEQDMDLWSDAYPACDIDAELAKMAAWLEANPKKAKKNYRRFITNWLDRAQDRGGTRGYLTRKAGSR